MAGQQPRLSGPDRLRQVTAALWLVRVSVIFGIVSGTVSVTAGLADRSLSVLAIGLGVLADVTGSATLIWRFRAERRQPGRPQAAEDHAAIVVAAALATVSAVITIQAAIALATSSGPGASGVTLIAGEPCTRRRCRPAGARGAWSNRMTKVTITEAPLAHDVLATAPARPTLGTATGTAFSMVEEAIATADPRPDDVHRSLRGRFPTRRSGASPRNQESPRA
jgi:hypothetical protein